MVSSHLAALLAHDRSLGVRFVAGADEAGRGCLAGPLVAAAVLLDLDRLTDGVAARWGELRDSKKISPAARERLYPEIYELATDVVTVFYTAEQIDSTGLHKINLGALREALQRVAVSECVLLSDGFNLGDFGSHRHEGVVKGDNTSAAIAAASVVAKVERDRFMREADATYPGWGFANHMGYATKAHREAIGQLGPSPIHRMSFNSTAYRQLRLDTVSD